MLPVLFAFGPVRIYTYPIFFLIAVFLFGFVIWKKGRELHFEESELFDAVIVISLWAILGSRLLFIFLAQFSDFGFNLINWFNLVGKPGMWPLGLMIFGGIAAFFQAKKRKWDLFNLTDVILTAYVLFQAVMALGAFFNGSGYGLVANNILGIRFGGMLDKHLPVQLYEFCFYLLIFWVLVWVEGKYRTFTWYKGQKSEALSGFITSMFFILMGVVGFLLSWIKLPQINWWGLRWDWLWWLIYLIFGAVLLYRRSVLKMTKTYTSRGERRVATTKFPQNNASRWGSDIFD